MNDLEPIDKIQTKKLLKNCFIQFNISFPTLKPKYNNVDEYIKGIIFLMRGIHEVITNIYGKHSEGKTYEKPKLFAIYPLVRVQIESIFNVAYLLRKPKEIELFESDSMYSAFSIYYFKEKIIDEVLNTDELKKKKEEVKKHFSKTAPKLENAEKEKNFYEIENIIENEEFPQWKFFPTPKKIINELKNNRIEKVLKFFYYFYKWLSSVVHGTAETIFTKEIIERGYYDRVKNKIEESLILSYLSILVVLTDCSSFMEINPNFKGALFELWKYLNDRSYFARYIFDNWAKKIFNFIEP